MIAALLCTIAITVGTPVEWADRTTGEVSTGVVTSIDIYTGYAWILPDRSKYWYAVEPMKNVTPLACKEKVEGWNNDGSLALTLGDYANPARM